MTSMAIPDALLRACNASTGSETTRNGTLRTATRAPRDAAGAKGAGDDRRAQAAPAKTRHALIRSIPNKHPEGPV